MNWLYWNFALSATDEVINFKEKRLSAIFWNLSCAFKGIWAILTGLSDDALTIIVPLVGRHSRSFCNISTMICSQPSRNLLFFSGAMFSFWTASLVAAPKSVRYSSSWLFFQIGEKFFVHHFSEIDSIVNFLFLVNQPHQTIKDQANFTKHKWKKWTITLENDKIWF